jgi:outer membrane protein assembly factor BamB
MANQAVPLSYPPVAADGVIYDLAGNLTEYAVNAATGKVIWHYTGGTTNSTALQDSPVVVNGSLFIGTGAGGLVALRS